MMDRYDGIEDSTAEGRKTLIMIQSSRAQEP